MKTRVYAINLWELLDSNTVSLSDDEFIEIAEQQGLVWTLEGFERAFNTEQISDEWMIRFINHK